MKFTSWNVNGLRAALGKGFLAWFRKTKPDVLNMQEIRVEWDQLDPAIREEFESEYNVCWFPCTVKKGYSGCATLSKKGLSFTHSKGLGIPKYDVEGRIIVSEHPSLTLIAGYFPNASTDLSRLDYKRQFAKDLTTIVKERHAKGQNVVVVGDMNVAPMEIDLANPKANEGTAGFTAEEREDFQGYLQAGLVDIFRERHPKTPKLYTWWSQRGGARKRNVGWRIDIFLVSKPLADKVKDAQIHPEVMGSDHCPISLELAL